MPINNVPVEVVVSNTETVNATKEVKRLLAIDNDYIAWEMDTIYDGKVVKKEFYRREWSYMVSKYPELIDGIEKNLVKETVSIDNMPVSTEQEKKAKSVCFGLPF